MWNTGRKIVCLDDHSRTLMAMGIVSLVTKLNPHDPAAKPVSVGLKPFDTLTREQQVAAVYEVGRALLCGEVVAPEPAMYRSATFLAVFNMLERDLRQEILTNNTTVRALALAAHRELIGKIDHGITRECTDRQDWDYLFKSIEKRLLDDRLFKVSIEILDLPPQTTAKLYETYRLNKDYFLAVPEDPTWPQAILLTVRVLTLCKDRLVRSVYEKLQDEHVLSAFLQL